MYPWWYSNSKKWESVPLSKGFPDWESPYDYTLIQSLITMCACTCMNKYVEVRVHTCIKRTKLLILEIFPRKVQQFSVSNRLSPNVYNSNFMIWSLKPHDTHTFTVRYHYSVPIQTIPTYIYIPNLNLLTTNNISIQSLWKYAQKYRMKKYSILSQ